MVGKTSCEDLFQYDVSDSNILSFTSDILRLPSELGQEMFFLDAFLGDALRFPLKKYCCCANPQQFSREKQKYSTWRETNPDDFVSPGFDVLWSCSPIGASEGKA